MNDDFFLGKDGFVNEKSFDVIAVYPAIISPKDADGFHLVFMPDFEAYTTAMTAGRSLAEAIFMARDYMGLMIDELKEQGTPLPAATPWDAIKHNPGDIVTLIDVDMRQCDRDDYRNSVE